MPETLRKYTCQQKDCGHEWWPRTPKRPSRCPKCKTSAFDRAELLKPPKNPIRRARYDAERSREKRQERSTAKRGRRAKAPAEVAA
jgi:hypothetical protein